MYSKNVGGAKMKDIFVKNGDIIKKIELSEIYFFIKRNSNLIPINKDSKN